MTLNEQHSRKDHILHIARGMMAAARTAPKAKGVDNLEIVTVTGDDLPRLAQKMRAMSEENGFKFFLRDANNVEQSDAVVVIGTRLGVFNLNCGMCGFPTCADKSQFESVPCAFNTNDLGIALGSAAAYAADHRIDSRIMYSAGTAARAMGLVAADCKAVLAILLSCSGKSPYFDRTADKSPQPGK